MDTVHLSPCVQSAVNSLPEKVTSWDLMNFLLQIHPEYVDGKLKTIVLQQKDKFTGEVKTVSSWLSSIRERYPREHILHTKLVVLGLYYVDDALNQIIPVDIIASFEEEIIFK